ncbi:MAG: hypothetical protein AAFX02_08800 [Pseudomonadota bacterium]
MTEVTTIHGVEPLLDATQVGAILSVKPSTILAWHQTAAEHFPKAVRLGRCVRWRLKDIKAMIGETDAPASEEAA